MNKQADHAIEILNRAYLVEHPQDAAELLENMDGGEVSDALAGEPVETLLAVWQAMVPHRAAQLLSALSAEQASGILSQMPPNAALRLLAVLDEMEQERYLAGLTPAVRKEMRGLLAYPPDTAGRVMDSRVQSYRGSMSASDALKQLRATKTRASRNLFIVNQENQLTARVPVEDLATADPDTPLKALAKPLVATVQPIAPIDEVVDLLEVKRLLDLPVVDMDGVLVGNITHDQLVRAAHEDATADMQTMVGASKDERALSHPIFAVRKRLPWMQINLLTAFMAAAVVGIFESTIAQFTALAVLLPVVAGQSGNAGAQALAVTMRGLALREITPRQWMKVTLKEIKVGLLNGIGVAITCGIGVYFWSDSIGLVMVITSSMILAMVAAGFAGAVVPITLQTLGQDPAQSSSIVLTTVTDIAGFFSFLGIATLLASLI